MDVIIYVIMIAILMFATIMSMRSEGAMWNMLSLVFTFVVAVRLALDNFTLTSSLSVGSSVSTIDLISDILTEVPFIMFMLYHFLSIGRKLSE